jgi:phage baseplate assembly protein gpV
MSVGYYKLTVSKVTITGANVWDLTIGDFPTGARVDPQSILIEKATGNFYVAGTFGGTVDFDPHAAVVNRTESSASYQDGFIAKYDRDMNLLWVNTYSGKVSFGTKALDFDDGDIVAVGNLTNTVDFGQGVILSATGNLSPFYIKINPAGATKTGFALAGTGLFTTINTSIGSKAIFSGSISTTTDMDPSSANFTLNTTVNNSFTAVYQFLLPLNTETMLESNKISISPNPVYENFNLSVAESLIGTDYAVYNALGSLILKGKINAPTMVVPSDNMVAGLYFVQVGGNFVRKLIKTSK